MRFSIIHKLKAKYEVNSSADCNKHNIAEIPSQNDSSEDTRPRIWLRIPFMGKQGEFLVKKLFKKIQWNFIQPVKFVIYDTKKISYFLPKKDKIPNASRSNIVYTNLLVLVATGPTYAKQKEIWLPDCRNTQIHKKV